MIDTHAHIDREEFDEDREEMLQRAFRSGIKKIIIPAIEPKDFDRVLKTAEKDERIFCGMGIHPHNAGTATDESLQIIENNAKDKKVAAIGEIGLDYYYDFTPKDVQQKAFRSQLRLAKKLNLPVIVHNRESDEDLLKIIEEEQDSNLSGVLHCFSSDETVLKKALDMGFHISFTGNITFKKSKLAEVVQKTPLDRIMLETDSPFMAPVPKRGKRNEPAFLKYTAEKIAEIKSISINEVIDMTSKTAETFFKLSLALVFVFLFAAPFETASAQEDDEYFYEGDEEYVDPFRKFIGIGPMVGFNTIVETKYLDAGDKDDSYEGILAYGAAASWYIFDYLCFEAAYIYSKNTKVTDPYPDLLEPHIHEQLDLTTHWIANPHSRINFYGTVGITFFFNQINTFPSPGADPELSSESKIGLNAGVGFVINIDFNFGVLTVSPEWRLGFPFGRSESAYYYPDPKNPGELISESIELTNFFSIPRINFLFYPYFD